MPEACKILRASAGTPAQRGAAEPLCTRHAQHIHGLDRRNTQQRARERVTATDASEFSIKAVQKVRGFDSAQSDALPRVRRTMQAHSMRRARRGRCVQHAQHSSKQCPSCVTLALHAYVCARPCRCTQRGLLSTACWQRHALAFASHCGSTRCAPRISQSLRHTLRP